MPACHIYHSGLDYHLHKLNFSPSEADPCLYIQHSNAGHTFAAVRLDDFLVWDPNTQALGHFYDLLGTKYNVKSLEHTSTYVGWTIKRTALAQYMRRDLF